MWIAKRCLETYECDGQPLEHMRPVNGIPTRCTSCARIKKTIEALKNLIVQQPFLVTEGMAGAPAKMAWETEEPDNKQESESEDGSRGDGMTKKERMAFREKVIKSFVETAGKGLTEDEVFGEGVEKTTA